MQPVDGQGTDVAILCGMESDLAPGETVHFPSQYTLFRPQTADENKRELARLAAIAERGARAVVGVYMRICDLVRRSGLSDKEVREALQPHFPPPRISDILRLAHAPESVYERYTAGFFTLKGALQQCRLYHITPNDELRQRKLRRTADKLIGLMGGPGQLTIKDRRITVE